MGRQEDVDIKHIIKRRDELKEQYPDWTNSKIATRLGIKLTTLTYAINMHNKATK